MPDPATRARDVSKDLDGAGALVTGGASGLGAATCRALAARGAQVAVVDQDEPGRMVALKRGVYTSVPAATILQGVKRVDVDALYDDKRYRPLVRQVGGKPMFLY